MNLTELEEKIKYYFQDSELLKQALTHSSYCNEQRINKAKDYERLEFLGDAVLELASSDYLFCTQQEMSEGEMTKMRSRLVCESSLAQFARKIELGKFMRLGKGEEATGGRDRDSIIADVLEAVIGAIYLDGGFDKAKDFVTTFVLSDFEERMLFYDSKTVLQEMIQSRNLGILQYELTGEKGPEHNKIFMASALLDGSVLGEGEGRTKKAAEQKAASQAILFLKKKL